MTTGHATLLASWKNLIQHSFLPPVSRYPFKVIDELGQHLTPSGQHQLPLSLSRHTELDSVSLFTLPHPIMDELGSASHITPSVMEELCSASYITPSVMDELVLSIYYHSSSSWMNLIQYLILPPNPPYLTWSASLFLDPEMTLKQVLQ